MNDSLTVVTDKGRYGLLDTVNATVYKNLPDTNYKFKYNVYFSPINIVEDSFILSDDTTEFSFIIPDWTRSGSYSIDYRLSSNGKSQDGSKLYHRAECKEEVSFNKVINDIQLVSHKDFVDNQRKIAKEWMEGKRIIERSDSAILEGSHPFDVTGITVYFNKVIMDTNVYHLEDTAKLWINIYSDIDMNCSLILSSTGSEVDTIDLSLSKETPNNFELKYPIIGFERGMNEMYLNLMRDSMSIAGMIQYFDVEIPDTIAPEITIISEPENTYSSVPYEVNVRISSPDSNNTIYDTLYYRTSSIGSYWYAVTSSKTGDSTYRYLIPAQSRGTLIEYYITARDSFGNCTQYPDDGLKSFWVLTPMKPLWSEPTYNEDTLVMLSWYPPSEMITYHCGIKSDTVNVKDTIVAVKFVPQYLPARLNKIGVSFADIDSTKSRTMFNVRIKALENTRDIDTIIVYIYQVCDSIPGIQIDSVIFERSIDEYEEFIIPDIQVNENGIFIGLKCSSDKGIIFDGYGTGSHSAIYSDNKWSVLTSGEAHISGFMSYIPESGKRQSSILSFNVLRYSYNDTIWSEIGSGISDTLFVDSNANENRRYLYKVEAKFDNPFNSFFSSPWDVFIDLTPPLLDTVLITSAIGDIVQINAILKDTSGIGWDSLGYEYNDSIFVIPSDSSMDSNYYYSMLFTEDTLNYFIVAYDSSLICNNARYPDTGYYIWINGNSGIFRKRLVDSTYVAKLPQNPVRNGTILKYALSRKANVKIALYNIMGRKLKTLDSGLKEQGYYSIPIGNDIMPSQGVYFITVELGDYKKTIKLVKLY